jgi:hypothetical protein
MPLLSLGLLTAMWSSPILAGNASLTVSGSVARRLDGAKLRE